MDLRIQKDDETALIEFDRFSKSLSVYGVSSTKIAGEVPTWKMAIFDNWELIMSN